MRRTALLGAAAGWLLLVGTAAAQSLLISAPSVSSSQGFDFYGPYLGQTVGLLSTSSSITTTATIGYNFQPFDNVLLGVEVAGRLNNAPDKVSSFGIHARAGGTFDNVAAYGFGGVAGDGWDIGAGAELGVTDHLALVGQVLAHAPYGGMPNAFHAEAGIRYHFNAFVPFEQPGAFADYPAALSGVAELSREWGVSEVRAGGALSNLELNLHNYSPFEFDLASLSKARLDTVEADVLFDSPSLLGWMGSPRPMLGVVVNAAGYESSAHAGLNWHWNLGDTPFYAELGAGLAVHNGYLTGAPAGYRNLGCRVLHEWQYGLGYNVNEHVTVTAEYKHISGAFFGCSPNDGVNNLGVSVGWKF